MASPPVAPRRPHVISAHGDDREDPWFWLRDREDPEVLAYLEAENAYTEAGDGPAGRPAQRPLRGDEGPDQGDRHVGARPAGALVVLLAHRGGEGLRHPLPAPRPRPRRSSRRPASPARRSRSCSTRTCWPRARTTSPSAAPRSATTTAGWPTRPTAAGDEKYELQFRPLDAEHRRRRARGRCPTPATAWPGPPAADYVFYVRMDEAQRPFQLWRHRAGHRPGRRRARLRGARPALLPRRPAPPGTRPSSSSACTAPTPPSGSPSRSADPLAEPRVVLPRREGVEYAVDHLTPGGRRCGLVPRADQRRGAGLPGARGARRPHWAPAPVAAWREVVPHRPGVRVEDVDAFAGALVLSERAEAQTQVASCPLAATGRGDPFAGDLLRRRLDRRRPSTARPPPGSAPTPSPTPPRCASGARRW